MKLTFLGTSHGIAEKHAFTSSTVVTVNGKHYIIDAGAPIMTLLQNHNLKFTDVKGIFITHPHSDHYMGLVEFTSQMNAFPHFKDVNIPAYVPDGDFVKRMMYFLTGKEEINPIIKFDKQFSNGNYHSVPYYSRVAYSVYTDGVIFNDENVKITAVKNMHVDNSYSFIVETKDKLGVFSGDLRMNMPDYPNVLLNSQKPIDFVVLEGAHTKLNTPEIIEILKNTKTKNMLVNHRYNVVNPDEEMLDLKNTLSPYFNFKTVCDNDVLEF